jgi:hypothetical protein
MKDGEAMKYYHKKRLLKLADFLRNHVEDKNFNLDIIAERRSCGTVGCAIGTLPQAFKGYGFKYVDDCYTSDVTYLEVTNGQKIGFALAEDFFGLNSDESEFLFEPDSYPVSHRSRNYVANRIEQFVKRGKRPV